MTKTNFSILHRLITWFAFVFVVGGIPALIIYAGVNQLIAKQNNQNLERVTQQIESDFRKFQEISDTESFWANLFQDFYLNFDVKNDVDKLKDLRKYYENSFDYIVWNGKNKFLDYSISPDQFKGNWQSLIRLVKPVFLSKHRTEKKKVHDEDIRNVKKMFGPQFIEEELGYRTKPRLLWPDSHMIKPLIWVGAQEKYGMLFLLRQKILSSNLPLRKAILEKNQAITKYKYNYVENNVFKLKTGINEIYDYRKKIAQVKYFPVNIIETPDAFIFPKVIKDRLIVVAIANKKKVLKSKFTAVGLPIIFLLLLFPVFKMSFNSIVHDKTVKTSVSWKLALLFLLANGFPVSVIMFTGYDYLAQKQFALFDEVYATSLRYLQNFDERLQSEKAKKILNIRAAEKNILPLLKKGQVHAKQFSKFVDTCRIGSVDLNDVQIYLIASNSKFLGIREGVYIGSKYEPIVRRGIIQKPSKKNLLNFFRAIGEYFTACLNRKPVDMKTSTEVEMLTESIAQMPLTNFFQHLLSIKNSIDLFALGEAKQDTFVDILSVSSENIYDYLLLVFFKGEAIQNDYLEHQLANLNKNSYGISFYALSVSKDKHYPRGVRLDKKMVDFTSNFTVKPSAPRQFLTIKGKKYLTLGMVGTFMKDFKLLAISPTSRIEKIISRQKKQLLMIGLMSITLSLTLGFIISYSILFPINSLMAGAKAIEQRQFDYRLPALSNDEFGEMAVIFNESMVDLEELKVAGFVQENLIPSKAIETGKFSLYGKSVPMGDLGGDYYDYFTTSENKFSVLIGDVAGHGVGAALIMAMAKAGILHSDDILDKPIEIVNKLHQLILASKTKKQRKIMTFQYISLNKETGEAQLANAGGCAPYFYSAKEKTVTEMKLKGPALGTFKRAKFEEIEVNFKPGDAIVFYTDGIVEARNPAGEEYTYERMLKTVKEKYNLDAKKFYEGIRDEYLAHLDGGLPDDDLTMIVLVYNCSNDSSAEELNT